MEDNYSWKELEAKFEELSRYFRDTVVKEAKVKYEV